MTADIMNVFFLVFFAYFILLALYYIFLAVVGYYESLRRSAEDEEEDYAAFSASSFSIPVSIIVPARNEELWIENSLLSILNQDYPQFEVIVVDDGSNDDTLKILAKKFKLRTTSKVYFDHFKTGKIRDIYRSDSYPNLTAVMSKESGLKKAGALNSALNLARYKYICVIDADTVLEPSALTRVMAQVQKNPEKTLGVGSYFGIVNDFKIRGGKVLERNFRRPLITSQNLEYVRTFIGTRAAWSRLNCMPIVAGGFGIWSRSLLLRMKGYRYDFTCEDLEITFRAHDYMSQRRERKEKILNFPYVVGWTEGPESAYSLARQRNRWQRVTIETVVHYRKMLFNPRYGLFGFTVMPYFIFYEVLGVFFEVAGIVFILAGIISGFLDFRVFLTIATLMVLSQMLLSFISILAFTHGQKILSFNNILKLMLAGTVEFFWYHWIVAAGRIAGTFDYLRGVRTFDQYARSSNHGQDEHN